MSTQKIFKVVFHNNSKVYELYARGVAQTEFYGFIELEELLFNEHTTLLVDPSEEKLKSEFEGVTRVMVPMHSIIRIDEVEKTGVPKISDSSHAPNVTPFPVGGSSAKHTFD